jgi:hypothetical protein
MDWANEWELTDAIVVRLPILMVSTVVSSTAMMVSYLVGEG